MPPIEAWEEAIARPSTGGSINTVSAARGPMCLGLHYRCLYPGWHRRRGIAFRRAELGTAEEKGRLNPPPCAVFAAPSQTATVTTAQSDGSSVYRLRFFAINRDTRHPPGGSTERQRRHRPRLHHAVAFEPLDVAGAHAE